MNILRVKRKCLELLERVEADQAYTHLLLQREAEGSSLAPEEFPVLVQLTRGTLENRAVIDQALARHIRGDLFSLPSYVRHVLRLGAYQILFLDRVKKRDVVFESVELVKKGKYAGVSGLVNAVLRKIEPASENAAAASLNFPEWLVERWSSRFGRDEVERFCDAANAPLPLYLRAQTSRISVESLRKQLTEEGVETEPSVFSAVSLKVLKLPKTVRINLLPSYRAGLFFVQDLSSTIVADIVASEKPLAVSDLCAAPGGKSCSIALSIESAGGVVHASDRTEKRVELIRDSARRLGIRNIRTSVRDALAEWNTGEVRFDVVLVDAPCSGFGTIGRKVDVRWSKSEQTLAELLPVQERLLTAAASSVKPGGLLVYSTCTIDWEENEGVVGRFLERHPDFSTRDLREVVSAELCTPEGFYRAWPHRHAMAGAFAAALRKA